MPDQGKKRGVTTYVAIIRRRRIEDVLSEHEEWEVFPELAEGEHRYHFRDLEQHQRHSLIRWSVVLVIVSVIFLAISCGFLHNDYVNANNSFQNTAMSKDVLNEAEQLAAQNNATVVNTGIYIENIKNVSIADSSFTADYTIWFTWEGDDSLDMANNFRLYMGTLDTKDVVVDTIEEGHHYQQVRGTATITRAFHTTRFPLETLQLNFYIEPAHTADRVLLRADMDDSTYNPSIYASGYSMEGFRVENVAYRYASDLGATFENTSIDEKPIVSEVFAKAQIRRSGFGFYIICFIAMWATLAWVLISLFLAARRRVDAMGMISGSLIGTAGNIMVGAGALPGSLDLGLLVFGNIWGVLNVIMITIIVVHINTLRSSLGGGERNETANYFGTVMLIISTVIVVVGNILLPLSAIM
jgi:hypothetical protein